jgi:hypothetical protein
MVKAGEDDSKGKKGEFLHASMSGIKVLKEDKEPFLFDYMKQKTQKKRK